MLVLMEMITRHSNTSTYRNGLPNELIPLKYWGLYESTTLGGIIIWGLENEGKLKDF